jgi:hypothetical protein
MPHGLTTAPTNPAPQWPSGYIEALREVGAQEKAIPFCIHERFRGIALAARPDRVTTSTAIPPAEPVRGPTRPSPTEQGDVTVRHSARCKSMHVAAEYVHASPHVKTSRNAASPPPARATTAAAPASRSATVPGQKAIKKDIGDFADFPRARKGLRLPVVASRAEVKAVLDRMQGREHRTSGPFRTSWATPT